MISADAENRDRETELPPNASLKRWRRATPQLFLCGDVNAEPGLIDH